MSEPLLPDTTSDEHEVGWGDDAAEIERDGEHDDSDDERFNAERPPHHDRD
jgi:hypothetical protein